MTSPMTSSEIPITQPYPDVIVYLRVRVRVRARGGARVTLEGDYPRVTHRPTADVMSYVTIE